MSRALGSNIMQHGLSCRQGRAGVVAQSGLSSIFHVRIHIDFAKRVLWEMLDSGGADSDGDNLISEQDSFSSCCVIDHVRALNHDFTVCLQFA